MKPLTAQQIRHAVGGRALNAAEASMPPVSAVCTDTRQMLPKSLFVCLKGENFDGHAFLALAAQNGAVAALVQDAPGDAPPALHLIHVADTRVALGRLAKFVRGQARAKVIAVAGSNGKTGTKLLIDAALKTKLRGTVSPKSFNNDVGVPLTLLPADPSQDYVVVEMGTNHPGEIRTLTKIATPDIAVITGTAAEHLEHLGDLGGVRLENASIVEGLTEKGLLVVNGDDDELMLILAHHYAGKKLTFGFKKTNDLFPTDVECDAAGTRFKLNGRLKVFVPLLGKHSACNALAAFAVGRRLGLTEEAIVQGLATAKGPEMRLELHEAGGVTLLNDAYNANPGSMRAALETLAALPLKGTPDAPGRGRRVAVLGDMLELGPAGEALHREVGELAAAMKVDALHCVGDLARRIADGAAAAGMPAGAIFRHAAAADAAAAVPATLEDGDLVLVKASRGLRLEAVARAIVEHRHAASHPAAS